MSHFSFLQNRPAPKPPAHRSLAVPRRRLSPAGRLHAVGVTLGLIGLELACGQPARADLFVWDGTPGNWYSLPSHWTGGGFPGSGDNAENNTLAAITLDQTATVGRFFTNGAFTLSGGGSFIGSKMDAGTDLIVNNIFTISGGTVQNCTVQPGIQNLGGPIHSVVFIGNGSTSNTLNRLDGTIVNADLDLNSNAHAAVRLLNTNTVNGTIALGASNILSIYDGSSQLILNGSLTGSGSVVQEVAGAATLTNNGLVNANVAGQTLMLDISNSINSAGGTLEATNGGILLLLNNSGNNSTTNNGTLTATGGGIVNINAINGGTFTGGAGSLINSVGGTINVAGAALRGTLNGTPGSSLVFSGDNGVNTGNSLKNTTSNITLDLSTHADAFANFIGTNTVNGAITLGTTAPMSGVFITGPAGTGNLVLGSTGRLTGFGNVFGDALTNNGLVSADTSGRTLQLGPSTLTTAGTVQVTNGATLLINSFSTNTSGTVVVQSGGTATLTHGLTQTAGLTQVDGVLNLLNNSSLDLSGGVLDGTGTINGSVTNNGGTVSPGDSPGTLTIGGDFAQGSGGTLEFQFTNTASDRLNVTGLLTTGGLLDVNYLGTAPYTGGVGSEFAFLSYGSLDLTSNGAFTIVGHDGFTFELIKNDATNTLDLKVLTVGSPVPEASTIVSFGLLLALCLGGVVIAARRKKQAA